MHESIHRLFISMIYLPVTQRIFGVSQFSQLCRRVDGREWEWAPQKRRHRPGSPLLLPFRPLLVIPFFIFCPSSPARVWLWFRVRFRLLFDHLFHDLLLHPVLTWRRPKNRLWRSTQPFPSRSMNLLPLPDEYGGKSEQEMEKDGTN